MNTEEVLVSKGSFYTYFPSVSSGTSQAKESINNVVEKLNMSNRGLCFISAIDFLSLVGITFLSSSGFSNLPEQPASSCTSMTL